VVPTSTRNGNAWFKIPNAPNAAVEGVEAAGVVVAVPAWIITVTSHCKF
jgi:hypothetical protein